MKSLSSIIKNYRTLQGNVITIGKSKVEQALSQPVQNLQEEQVEVIQKSDFTYLVEEAKKEAFQIIEEAKKEAETILNNVELEKENSINEFYAQKAELEKRAKEEYESILQEANKQREAILEQAYNEKETLLKQAEPEVVEIMTQLLHKIIDAKIISGREWLTLFVRQAIEKEQLRDHIKVYLSKASYELHQDLLTQTFATLPITIDLEVDGRLCESECIIETKTGTITYNIEKGLEQVIDEMKLLCEKR